jgi:hypothetical protein
MNRKFILLMAGTLALATLFTSCHPSRVWANKKKEPKEKEYREREKEITYERRDPPPPPVSPRYERVALVVSPYAGFVMRQTANGRFYHTSNRGFTYWKGADNRFYIDSRDIRNVSYTRDEYDEWRRGYRG